MKLDEVLEKFLTEQRIKGNSEETIEYYRKRIGYFIKYTGNISIYNLNIDSYNLYAMSIIKNKNLSSYTIKTTLNACKIFLRYICTEYTKQDFYKSIKPYKCDKKTIVVLTQEQIQEILSYYDNSYYGIRNLLIISLMLDAGLRVSEVANLKYDDFIVERRLIKVFGKGHKERFVPITDHIFAYYCQFYYMNKNHNGYIFMDKEKKITSSGISQVLRRLRKALGYKKLHPHYLRHTFATLFLINGGDPLHLQLILGHTTLYMTEQYVHIANSMTLPKQSKYSPLSNLQNPLVMTNRQ